MTRFLAIYRKFPVGLQWLALLPVSVVCGYTACLGVALTLGMALAAMRSAGLLPDHQSTAILAHSLMSELPFAFAMVFVGGLLSPRKSFWIAVGIAGLLIGQSLYVHMIGQMQPGRPLGLANYVPVIAEVMGACLGITFLHRLVRRCKEETCQG